MANVSASDIWYAYQDKISQYSNFTIANQTYDLQRISYNNLLTMKLNENFNIFNTLY